MPVDAEPLGPPAVYGNDRVFAYLRLAADQDAEQERAVAALEAAGHPVVRIVVSEPMQLGQEFFRWEMATAVAGSIIGINPFDQPDVEASKVKTRDLTDGLREDRRAARARSRSSTDGGFSALRRPEERGGAGARGDEPDRGAQGPFRPHRRRRLCGAARLYRAQPRPYRDAADAGAG